MHGELQADTINSLIRRIDLATRTVTTFAGYVGMNGRSDGIGSNARFFGPYCIVVNSSSDFALVVSTTQMRDLLLCVVQN